jgi:hypothetical protein
VIARGVVDLYLGRSSLAEDQLNAARLSRSLDFIANSGPGTDQTVLGQHHGYVLTHLKPRISTAQQRAQTAGLNPTELESRFSSPDNIKQIATQFVQQGKHQKPAPVKSFSAIAAKNLSDHLIALSGATSQQKTNQIKQAQQLAAGTRKAAIAAIHNAMASIRGRS